LGWLVAGPLALKRGVWVERGCAAVAGGLNRSVAEIAAGKPRRRMAANAASTGLQEVRLQRDPILKSTGLSG
jgi:hypothetical protein